MNTRNISILEIMVLFTIGLTTTTWGADDDIEGDWRVILTEQNASFVLKIERKPDGTLTAGAQGIQLEKVTFENGKLHLEGGSPRSTFDGTLKEDGVTIEGQWNQQGTLMPAVFKRIEKTGTEGNQQELDTVEYYEKTKNEILQGRTFSDQSTAVNALLTLISAFHHQDQKTLEQIFPVVKMKQYEQLLSPKVRSQMLAAAKKAIFCRIEIGDIPPKESDLCAIFTSESPEKTIDQVWSFTYVKGAWRFAGATGDMNNWTAQARQAEAMTRNILQAEAKKSESKSGGESDTEVAKASEGRKRLIARWKLDNDANDSAGANHGSLHGDPVFEAGKLGQAIHLDGDDYVDCGNASVLNFGTGDWAISAWIKTTQTGTNASDEQMNRGTIFANGGDEVEGIRVALILNDSQLGMMTLTTDDNINNKVQTMGGIRVNDGAWHHVVGMRNSNQLHLYIDGKLNGRSVLYDDYDLSGVSQHNAYIGAITDNRDKSSYKYFVGIIDEVCVFACALDANSVSALYSGKDPMVVAKQITAVTEPDPQPQQIDVDIEGDWKGIIETRNVSCVIKIQKKADGTLTAILTAGETTIPFSKITFTNGKLRLEAISFQITYEGTVKADGSTIEGHLQQTGQQMAALVLKRVEQVRPKVETQSDSDTTTGPSDQPPTAQSDGGGSIVTTLVLIIILVGMIGGIVLFIRKSSIRR